MGLVVVTAAATAFDYIGLPEGIYPIAEATLYLATAAKSNSVGAYFKALELINKEGAANVPAHLMDKNRDAAALGHGKGYLYPHDFPDHHVKQQYLPDEYQGMKFYEPSDQGYENEIKKKLDIDKKNNDIRNSKNGEPKGKNQ